MKSPSGNRTGSLGGGRSSQGLLIVSLRLKTIFLQLRQEEESEAESMASKHATRNLNILATASFLMTRLLFSLASRLGKMERLSEKAPHFLMSSGSSGSILHSSSSSCFVRCFFLGGFWPEAFFRLVMTNSAGGVGFFVVGDGGGSPWTLPELERSPPLSLTREPPPFSNSEADE